jgi:hypothetical protein
MSDPYGIARQGAQANGMLNSLKKEMYQKSLNRMNNKRVGVNPVRKTQPFRVGGSQPVTNMPVGKPRPVLPSRPAMEAKKISVYKGTLDQRAKKTMEMMKNKDQRKADLESMKKADYSRVIAKRNAKKNTSKTLKKMVAKKSAKGSYQIGNGPNKASY